MACIFCQIAAGERDANIVYSDEQVVAFRDIDPRAPVHILIIPRTHISGPADFNEQNAVLAGHLIAVAAAIARREGITENGYRLVFNQGRDGGQSVFHAHLHLLAGRRMSWPPG